MPVFGEKELATKTDIQKHQNECYANHVKPIMDEIKTLTQNFNDFKLEIITLIKEMPGTIFDKTDLKYASKEVETKVDDMIKQNSNRTYDWLKYSIITAISILLAVLGFFYATINVIKKDDGQITKSEIQTMIEANNQKYFEKK